MRNTVVFDRVLLFKNKFEQHLQEQFDILPQHYKQIKPLLNIELDKIAERLDFMMTEHEWFAGDVQRCTINAFVNNFNNLRSSEQTKVKIDESKKAKEIEKKMEQNYFKCEKCSQQIKRTEKFNHENYTCPTLLHK